MITNNTMENSNNKHSSSVEQLGKSGAFDRKQISYAFFNYRNQLNNVKGMEGTNEEEFAQHKARDRKIELLNSAGNTALLGYTSTIGAKLPSFYWKYLSENVDFVSAVKNATEAENDVIEFVKQDTSKYTIIKQGDHLKDVGEVKQDGNTGYAVFENMSSQLSKYGKRNDSMSHESHLARMSDEAFQAKKALHERGLDINLDTSAITVNNFTQEEQEAKKAEWIKNNPEEAKHDREERDRAAEKYKEVDTVKEEAFQAKKALHETGLDLNLDVSMNEQNAKDASERIAASIEESTKKHLAEMSQEFEKLTSKPLTEGELLLLAEEGLKNCKEAMPKIEKAEAVIEKRTAKAKEGLMALGLKAIDKYRGIKTWKKVAFGLGLAAGSAVVGGGVVAVAVAVAMKSLGAASTSRGFYEGMLKAEQEDGNDPHKKLLAARSILYGTLLTLGTSALVSNIVEHYQTSHSGGGNSAPGVVTGASNGQGGTPAALFVGGGEDASAAAPATLTPEAREVITELNEYIVKPGDNLTKIISTQILDKVEGESLTDFQKENIVQNLLKLSARNPDEEMLATIHQFTNPDLIHPGDKINAQQLYDVITKKPIEDFNGQTLLEHARTLSGQLASHDGYGSSVVEKVPDIVAKEVAGTPVVGAVAEEAKNLSYAGKSVMTGDAVAAVNLNNLHIDHYVIQEGDTYQSIVKKVIDTIDGGSQLSDQDKEWVADKLLRDSGAWFGVSDGEVMAAKLGKAGGITVGEKINLTSFRDSVKFNMSRLEDFRN